MLAVEGLTFVAEVEGQAPVTLTRWVVVTGQRPRVATFTSISEVRSQLSLSWGTETFLVPDVGSTDAMVKEVDKALLELGRYNRGDQVVIVAGAPPGTVGSTNLIHVHRIGEDDH